MEDNKLILVIFYDPKIIGEITDKKIAVAARAIMTASLKNSVMGRAESIKNVVVEPLKEDDITASQLQLLVLCERPLNKEWNIPKIKKEITRNMALKFPWSKGAKKTVCIIHPPRNKLSRKARR